VADGVIIGSRLVELVAGGQEGIRAAASFIREVRQALDEA
jgi:tryptophan synthase alpha subunit